MPFIEQLLNGENVEWKPLGEVCEYEQPSKYLVSSTMYNDSYPIPVLTAGKSFILGYTNENFGIYKASEHQTIIFDDFTTDIKWVDFDFKAKSSAMKMITSKDENIALLKFIYYWLCTLPQETNIGNHKRNWISKYTKLLIPLPPLSVQHKIVEILDKFTELEAELEAELDCRKRQYEYYRNQLLSFDMLNRGQKLNGVKIMTLGEIAKYSSTRIKSSCLCETSFVGVDNLLQDRKGKTISTHVPTEGTFAEYQVGDILIGNIRPYLKKIWYADNSGGASGDVLVIHLTNEQIMSRYLYQVLADDKFFSYNMQHAKGAKMPRGNKQKIMEYKIPLPPLSVQREIVEILDKFDTLCNSISEGLPKEIELRRKQYEYYRNQLLTFAQ